MLQECIPGHSGYQRVTSQDLIYDRTMDIQTIEEDTIEIFDLMKDLDGLVSDQDDDIMHIEDSIRDTHDNTKKATDELRKANRKKRSKRWCRITALLVGGLLIIGGILILII